MVEGLAAYPTSEIESAGWVPEGIEQHALLEIEAQRQPTSGYRTCEAAAER